MCVTRAQEACNKYVSELMRPYLAVQDIGPYTHGRNWHMGDAIFGLDSMEQHLSWPPQTPMKSLRSVVSKHRGRGPHPLPPLSQTNARRHVLRVHIHTYMIWCIHIYIRIHRHAHIHTYIYVYMLHIYTHISIYMHIYI